jgi:folylpolyglutamate synthase/dihydropteroate synthase
MENRFLRKNLQRTFLKFLASFNNRYDLISKKNCFFLKPYRKINFCIFQIPDLEKFPAYFKFLTLMAFHIFIKERVDVAVIEVGIGGEYDCTNVLRYRIFQKIFFFECQFCRNPIVCGISTLDFDHISILGSTLKEIAWHKAGIMKPNSVAVGVEQSEEAMEVIRERSQEKKVSIQDGLKVPVHFEFL